jgi:hypothetical protein
MVENKPLIHANAAQVMKDETGRPFIIVREYVMDMRAIRPHHECVLVNKAIVKARRRGSMAMRQSNRISWPHERWQTSSRHRWYDQ